MDGFDLLTVVFFGVVVLALAAIVRSFVGTPRRERLGYTLAAVIYASLALVFRLLPGDEGAWPARLVAATLAVAVAVDVLRQVPRSRPAPWQAGVAVVGWGIGTFFGTPLAVAFYVARRVMHLPVIRRPRQPVSSARSLEMSGGASAASTAVERPKND